jgi:hypothetical protein
MKMKLKKATNAIIYSCISVKKHVALGCTRPTIKIKKEE